MYILKTLTKGKVTKDKSIQTGVNHKAAVVVESAEKSSDREKRADALVRLSAYWK